MRDAISVQNVSYTYPDEDTPALQDMDFTVKKGSITGIIGPSGCGKSTLMHILSGLTPHSLHGKLRGDVMINDILIKDSSLAKLSQQVQILFQNPEDQLFALNVEDEITFGPENLALPWEEIERRRDKALKNLDIEHLRRSSIEELSSGQKQIVALASVMSMEPSILLFDEPTANLDPKRVKDLKTIIRKLKKKHTIVIVEHNISLVQELCERTLLIDKGRKLMEGKTSQVIGSKTFKRVMDMSGSGQRLEALPSSTDNETILELKDYCFSYGDNPVLKNIDLAIGKGDVLGIIGMNGSGKSTLALNLIGLLKGKGALLLKGKDIKGASVFERASHIGYAFQNPDYQLFEETVKNEVMFGPKNLGLSTSTISRRTKEALQAVDLTQQRTKDPHALSVGQKRRVSIASILSMKPEILIIDEPDTGLDLRSATHVLDHVKEMNHKGMTVIMISHNLDLLSKYCNRIIGIDEGRIVPASNVLRQY